MAATMPSCLKRGTSAGFKMLRVFDAPAQVSLARVLLEHALINVQHLAVGAIANGVCVYLEAVFDSHTCSAFNVLRLSRVSPRLVGGSM